MNQDKKPMSPEEAEEIFIDRFAHILVEQVLAEEEKDSKNE